MTFCDDILNAMLDETALVKGLSREIKPEYLDYRPTPAQRSVRELLMYLPTCALRGVEACCLGDRPLFEKLAPRCESMNWQDFATLMDEQVEGLKHAIAAVDDEALASRTARLPDGREAPLGQVLLLMGPQCLTAYRMQLFLYLKAAGASHLDSSHCWLVNRDA